MNDEWESLLKSCIPFSDQYRAYHCRQKQDASDFEGNNKIGEKDLAKVLYQAYRGITHFWSLDADTAF